MEDKLQRSSFCWSSHSTYTVKLICYSLLLNYFWYGLLVLKCMFVGGSFGVDRSFVSFLSAMPKSPESFSSMFPLCGSNKGG